MKMWLRFFKPVLGPALLLPAASLFLVMGLPVLAQAPPALKIPQAARVYPDPDLASRSLGLAPAGAEITVVKQLGGWYKVRVAGLTGWLPRGAVQGPLGEGSLLHGDPVREGGSEDSVIGVLGRKAAPDPDKDLMMAQKADKSWPPADSPPAPPPVMAEKPPAFAEKAPGVAANAPGPEAKAPRVAGAKPAAAVKPSLPGPERALKRGQALYPDPDETAGPLTRIPAGARVAVVKQLGDWLKVKYRNMTGWLPAQALKE